jgi:hypothetical protein
MRYLLIFFIAIGLIVLIFILILKNFSSTPVKSAPPLINYATTNTVVEVTIDGPVVADQNYQAIQMIVGQSQNQINITQGYQGTVISTQSYQNNESAYATFLRAIDLAGFTRGNPNPNVRDSRGFCSQGDTYNFTIVNGSTTVQDYWSTSCGGNLETSTGNVGLILALFQAQFPDYSTITANVPL